MYLLIIQINPKLVQTVAYAESFRGGPKFCHNQLGECLSHDHYRVVRGHTPKNFCKITPKNTHFRIGQIGSFPKTKKAFAVVDIQIQGPEARISKNWCSLEKKKALISSLTFISQHHVNLQKKKKEKKSLLRFRHFSPKKKVFHLESIFYLPLFLPTT